MGRSSRDRRRQRDRRLQAAERARERRRAESEEVGRQELDAVEIERLFMAAVDAHRRRDKDEMWEAVDALTGPPGYGLRALVDAGVARCVRRAIAAAQEEGWDAIGLERVVRRRLGREAAKVVGEVDAAPAGDYLQRVYGDLSSAILTAAEVLELLTLLPPLPKLRSAERSRCPADADARILERVRALLAKAESTTFPEEAEALSAKAQELMARYAIDRALLGGVGDGRHGVGGRRIHIDDPYARSKFLLVDVVADANRCRAVWSREFRFATVFGADDDLDIVELMFTSLLCQATAAMTAAGSAAQEPFVRGARSRSFRQSFLVAYATRIGARLREASEAATEEASQAHGPERLLPVLAARKAATDAAVRAAFPHLRSAQFSAHDSAGWAAGVAAADVASLDTRRAVKGAG